MSRRDDALRAHVTQVDPDGFWFHVPRDLEREAYPYEAFLELRCRRRAEPSARRRTCSRPGGVSDRRGRRRPEAAAPDDPSRRSARRWRSSSTRDFGPYFVGNVTSSIGTWFQNLAAAILVYRLTRSTLLVGVVNFAQFIGAVVLAPWAGSAADRYDRRKLLIVTQLVAFAVDAVSWPVLTADRTG